MYILFAGEVGIYISDAKCVAVLRDSKVFGERALDNDDLRGATIIAHQRSECLVLYKDDYKDIIYVSFLMRQQH